MNTIWKTKVYSSIGRFVQEFRYLHQLTSISEYTKCSLFNGTTCSTQSDRALRLMWHQHPRQSREEAVRGRHT